MITLEQVKEALEKVNYGDTDFIINHLYFDWSSIIEYHRDMINELWLSFWIWELFISWDQTETIVYIKYNNDKDIRILDTWLDEFKSLEDYTIWLNEMEYKVWEILITIND